MPDKTDSEKLNEVYLALKGNPDMGIKPPIERLFDMGESLKKTIEKLPCQVPEAPCPKNSKGVSSLITFLKTLSPIERLIILIVFIIAGSGGGISLFNLLT